MNFNQNRMAMDIYAGEQRNTVIPAEHTWDDKLQRDYYLVGHRKSLRRMLTGGGNETYRIKVDEDTYIRYMDQANLDLRRPPGGEDRVPDGRKVFCMIDTKGLTRNAAGVIEGQQTPQSPAVMHGVSEDRDNKLFFNGTGIGIFSLLSAKLTGKLNIAPTSKIQNAKVLKQARTMVPTMRPTPTGSF